MGLLQLVQLVLAITCCYAKFPHPFHPSMPQHRMLRPPLYREGFHNHNTGHFLPRQHVQIFPTPMNKPPFNGIHYVKPKFFMHTKPLHMNIKSMSLMKPMLPMKHIKSMHLMKPFKAMKHVQPMKPFKPMKPIKIMNKKEMKYIKKSFKPKTPFKYLKIKSNKPPMYQPPPSWINQRQPIARPPTRIFRRRQSFQPPATPNIPQPQYPTRTYTPNPMPRHQPAYDIPRAQPPTFNDGTSPQVQPPVVDNRRHVDNSNQPSSGEGILSLSRFPGQTYTSQPIQPSFRPSKREYVEPKVIPEEKGRNWLPATSSNFDDDSSDSDEDSDDSEEKWEKRSENFDDSSEDSSDSNEDSDDSEEKSEKRSENFDDSSEDSSDSNEDSDDSEEKSEKRSKNLDDSSEDSSDSNEDSDDSEEKSEKRSENFDDSSEDSSDSNEGSDDSEEKSEKRSKNLDDSSEDSSDSNEGSDDSEEKSEKRLKDFDDRSEDSYDSDKDSDDSEKKSEKRLKDFNDQFEDRNDSDEDRDDVEKKSEKRFQDFNDGIEDKLEKRKEANDDNDDGDMFDDKIFESFDKLTRLRMNMARNRKYLEDFKKENDKDLDSDSEKSDSRSDQQRQRFQSGRLAKQPTHSKENRIERQNKLQEKFFDKLDDKRRQQPRQQVLPINRPLGANSIMREIKYDVKYSDDLKNRARNPNLSGLLSNRNRNSRLTLTGSDFGKSFSERNNYDENYFDRKGDLLPPSSIFSSQANRGRQSIDTRRNSDDEKYFERKRGSQGFLQTNRPFISMRNIGRNKNDDKYFETKSVADKNYGRNNYGDKSDERDFNRRRFQQHNTRAIMPEASTSFANRQSQRPNSGHQTINQVHRAKTQTNENGMARPAVTRQVTFGDNTASKQMIQYQRDNDNKYLENKDEFRRDNTASKQMIQYQRDNDNKYLENKDEFRRDNTASKQMIQYQRDNDNKYLGNKDEFRRTIIKHLAEVQNNIGSQRGKRTFQHIRSSSIPKASGFYKS